MGVVFRWLVRLGSPACWRQANVTPIPKGLLSSYVANYRPITVTSVLSKVFERLVSVHLGRFIERSGAIPTTQFALKVGVPVMHFVYVPYTAKCIGEWPGGPHGTRSNSKMTCEKHLRTVYRVL